MLASPSTVPNPPFGPWYAYRNTVRSRATVAGVLFVMIVVNATLFGGVAAWAIRFARTEDSPRLRPLGWALSAVSLSFVLGAVTRGMLVAADFGWFGGRMTDVALGRWHLLQTIGATAMGVAGIIMVRKVASGLKSADRIAQIVSRRLLDGGSLEQFGLTERELEVLEQLCGGRTSDQELADVLYIAPSTAGTHVKNIMRKTGVRSRRELILLAESART